MVSFSSFNEDANATKFDSFFKRKASPLTKNVIGVHMTVFFIFENQPVFGNEMKEDKKDERSYKFLLELDGEDNIIGGEWTENKHPIFIWIPVEGVMPLGDGGDIFPSFDGSVKQLQEISDLAKMVSQNNTVLGAIVHYLVEKSSISESPSTLEFIE